MAVVTEPKRKASGPLCPILRVPRSVCLRLESETTAMEATATRLEPGRTRDASVIP